MGKRSIKVPTNPNYSTKSKKSIHRGINLTALLARAANPGAFSPTHKPSHAGQCHLSHTKFHRTNAPVECKPQTVPGSHKSTAQGSQTAQFCASKPKEKDLSGTITPCTPGLDIPALIFPYSAPEGFLLFNFNHSHDGDTAPPSGRGGGGYL